jgi:hypothetical protein
MATVTPGTTFISGQIVTPANLNAAATPVVTLNDGEVTDAKVASGINPTKLIGQGHLFVSTIYYTAVGTATFSKASYPWLRAIRVKCQGGGGGGGSARSTGSGETSVGGSGGGGAYGESFITDIAGLASSVTVTVGAGGAGGAAIAAGQDGSNGGTSSFGALVSAGGGGGGVLGSRNSFLNYIRAGGTSGNAATADLSVRGTRAATTFVVSSNSVISALGGGAFLGQGASGASDAAGFLGFQGGGGSGAAATQNTSSARAGGAGGAGIVIVELYA